ncbi:DUF5801 repeats-in-toxin domain-containing protein [Aphanothece stagnina]|uniref:DUF5801 repeats-in-toxin domain-containing protein n=1 Tax=Aphanothece stagnina TaxID=1004305 RepID=UPI00398F7269
MQKELVDEDGDSVSQKIDLTGKLSIEDAGPTLGEPTGEVGTAFLDESDLPADLANNPNNGIDDGVYSTLLDLSSNFAAGDLGTDVPPGETNFTVLLSGTAVNGVITVASGLFILDPTVITGDIGKGAAINLVDDGSGVVRGVVAGTDQQVFTISVNGSGVVTFAYVNADGSAVSAGDDPANIWHRDTSSGDEAETILAETADTLLVRQELVDEDGDSVFQDIDLGGKLSIQDDAPELAFADSEGTASAATAAGGGIDGFWTGSRSTDSQTEFYDPSTPATNDGFIDSVTLTSILVNGNQTTLVGTPAVTTINGDIVMTGQYNYDLLNDNEPNAIVDFELTIREDGTYTLVSDLPPSTITFDTESDSVTLASGGPSDTRTATITKSTGETLSVDFTDYTFETFDLPDRGVNVSGSGIGVQDNIFESGEAILVDPDDSTLAPGESIKAVNLLFTGTGDNQFDSAPEEVIFLTVTDSNNVKAFVVLNPDTIITSYRVEAGVGDFSALADIDTILIASPVDIDGGKTDTKTKLGLSFELQTTEPIAPVPVDFNFVVTTVDGDGDSVADPFTVSILPETAPVALDLDLSGSIDYLSLDGANSVQYDYGSGLVSTAWVGPADGILVYDDNQNPKDGVITNFLALRPEARTDLEAIALAFDNNQLQNAALAATHEPAPDGVLDAQDSEFANFGVWVDANSNGALDDGEYRSLADAGILSISLTSDGIAYATADSDVYVYGSTTYAYETLDANGDVTVEYGLAQDVAFATAPVGEDLAPEVLEPELLAPALDDGSVAFAEPDEELPTTDILDTEPIASTVDDGAVALAVPIEDVPISDVTGTEPIPPSADDASVPAAPVVDELTAPDAASEDPSSSTDLSDSSSSIDVPQEEIPPVVELVQAVIDDPSVVQDPPTDTSLSDAPAATDAASADVPVAPSTSDLVTAFSESESISDADLADIQHDLNTSLPDDPALDTSFDIADPEPAPTVDDVVALDAAEIDLPQVDDVFDVAYTADEQPDVVSV